MSINDGYSSTNVSPTEETTAKFDRSELVRGWREYETRMPRVVPILKYAAKTDMGQVRENNEDKFDTYEPEDPAILAARGSLFIVADGIGGAQAGQIASEMLVKSLIAGYYEHPAGDIQTALYETVVGTNDRIHSLAQMIPERSGMGSTLTAAVFVEDRVIITQVGDSRAYLIRDGEIRQVSQDHSWVEEQVRAGMMSREDAEMSPFRNVITRSVGASPSVQPDFYVEETRVGDTWVLCSDGLTGHVEEGEIAQIAAHYPPSEAARQLIELANARGGRDNITVFILSVRDLIPPPATATDGRMDTVVRSSGNAGRTSAPTEENRPIPSGQEEAVPASTEESGRGGWRKLFGRT